MIYISEPHLRLILSNINPNDALYQATNGNYLVLTVIIEVVVIILIFLTLYFYLYLLFHNLIISRNLKTKQIIFKVYFHLPKRLFMKQMSEILLPLENIKSLQITYEPYRSFSTTGIRQEEAPFITISSDSWQGNEKLLKRLSSRAVEGRMRLFGFDDSDILNKIIELFIDFAV